ncbi:hypothetical protein VNI00_009692 [Paramarasmius palmivorus]|uniref:BZIP domain-containing protein n=1 Tax=Paramarasmius palmivorus TaxID=297713 RepID=A0AAW0CPT5_9AGAR
MFRRSSGFSARAGSLNGIQGDMNVYNNTHNYMHGSSDKPVNEDNRRFSTPLPSYYCLPSRDPHTLPNERYSQLLLEEHRGYPLWFPQPNAKLAAEYVRRGAEIGDVEAFLKQAIKHGASWIEYALSRGRVAPTLYLVTGCDKSSSWGIASFLKHPDENLTLSFHEEHTDRKRSTYKWNNDTSSWCTAHCSPETRRDPEAPVLSNFANQSLFLRGFIISRHGKDAGVLGVKQEEDGDDLWLQRSTSRSRDALNLTICESGHKPYHPCKDINLYLHNVLRASFVNEDNQPLPEEAPIIVISHDEDWCVSPEHYPLSPASIRQLCEALKVEIRNNVIHTSKSPLSRGLPSLISQTFPVSQTAACKSSPTTIADKPLLDWPPPSIPITEALTATITESTASRRILPLSLIPDDAPTQARRYVTPSTTSRKEVPATFAGKRKRVTQSDDEEDELEALPPNATEKQQIEYRRRQNTLAARRSRKRKLLYQQELEETVERLQTAVETWKAKVELFRGILIGKGIAIDSLPEGLRAVPQPETTCSPVAGPSDSGHSVVDC